MREPKQPFELHREAPLPPKPLPLAELTKDWGKGRPRVSILCPTYQHVSFIRDALDGFLSQVTNFPFELIVRDDASTDGTQDVLLEYGILYPGVLSLILESKNTWPIEKPLQALLEAAQGDFVAICEGDDYWFDPYRLQHLIDEIDSKPNASLVEDGALVVEGSIVKGFLDPGFGGLRTWVIRSRAIDQSAIQRFSAHIFTGDGFLQAMAESFGERIRIDSHSCVYREHEGGIYTGLRKTNNRALQVQRSISQYWISVYLYEGGFKSRSKLHAAQALEILSQSHPLGTQSLLLQVTKRYLARIVLRVPGLRQCRKAFLNLIKSG